VLNKVLLMGRLTRDPEVRYTANTNALVCSFSLAVGRNFKREGQPDADFINIVAWGKTGEFCSKYFTKGQQVAVCGRLQREREIPSSHRPSAKLPLPDFVERYARKIAKDIRRFSLSSSQ
jgi:hypothetical protein